MKRIKKLLICALCFALGASLSLVGTIAYLKDETDTVYNVMTSGNVKIEMLEYERAVDDNGNWIPAPEYNVTFGADTYTPDKLQPFTQGKPLYPAVYNNVSNTMAWDDRNGSQVASGAGSHQQGWAQIGAPGSNQLFDDSVANVIDKFVFVKNTGSYNAYVRTVFAFEAGNLTPDEFDEMMHVNANGGSWDIAFDKDEMVPATINGVNYYIGVATYKRNGGVVTPGEITRPSLLQLFLDPEATNETVESFGDTYDILVITQATQVEGFEDLDGDGMTADDALDRAFGAINATQNPWTGKTVSIPNIANTPDEFADLLENGGSITLGNDIDADETIVVPEGATVELDLNGMTLTSLNNAIENHGTLVISGNGVIDATEAGTNALAFDNYGTVIINGGTFKGEFSSASNATLIIKGGTFDSDPSAYVADGYVAIENTVYARSATTTYTVLPIDDEATLRLAMEKLDAIKLMGNIDLGDTQLAVTEGKSIVIDLNGMTLTGGYNGADHYAMFTIPNGATLTIEGEGFVNASTAFAESNRSGAIFQNAGNLVINGGKYNLTDATEGKTWIIATIVDNRTKNASCATLLTINDGEFSIRGNAINLFRNYPQQGGSATIKFNGGVYKANPDKDTTYIWNQESRTYLGELYFNGGVYDSNIVYEDYNGQDDIHIADGVVIGAYSGNA